MLIVRRVEQKIERIIIVPERDVLILDFGEGGIDTIKLPDEVWEAVRTFLIKKFGVPKSEDALD